MNLHTMTKGVVRILNYREKNNFEGLDLSFGFDEPGLNNLALNLKTSFQEQDINLDERKTHQLMERLPNWITENQEEDREPFYEKLVSILEPIEIDKIDNLEEIPLYNGFGGRRF